MKKINWSGHKWITQERWGKIHKSKTYCHYDSNAVSIDKNGVLHLFTRYNPVKFKIDGVEVLSKFGVGLISSEENFGHGLFEIECMLPVGKNLWPAFWMWGENSWPPEVDFFEAYSNNRGSYFKPEIWPKIKIWNIKSNIHYRTDRKKRKTSGAKGGWLGWNNPSKHFIKYECLWKPDLIEIKYNGKIINRVTDKKILSDINSQKHRIIINNHLRGDGNDTQISDFKIKSFKYTKLKNC